MTKNFLYPLFTLSGTIIGVGIFSLPYITLQVGIWTMLGYFLFLAPLVIFIHYLFGEIALKTPDFSRLSVYAKIHLGSWGEKTALISNIFGFLGAILAYLIIGGEFLNNFLSPIFGENTLFYNFIYFFAGAVLIYGGIKSISKIEFWGMIIFFIILILIFLKGLPFFKTENLFLRNGPADVFLPYGPILFSLWGASVIPEIEEMLGDNKKSLRKIIFLGILIPVFIYLFFIFLVLGVSGLSTTPEALAGLKNVMGNGAVYLGFFAGILATFTSFITIGLTLKKVLWYDLKISKNISWLISCFTPFLFLLLGFKDFVKIIGLVGAVALGVDGILIILMYGRISKNKLVYPLILIFLGGIFYEIIYFLN